MEWYVAVILVLSATSLCGLVFVVKLVFAVDDLRTENAKLKIDLRHSDEKVESGQPYETNPERSMSLSEWAELRNRTKQLEKEYGL